MNRIQRKLFKGTYDIYTHRKILNNCTVYELSWNFNIFDFGLENCMFSAVKLIKMQILVNTNIEDMVLGLIHTEMSYNPVVNFLKT